MRNENSHCRLDQAATYRIKIHGRLDEAWSAWFDDMAVTVEKGEHGVAITTLTGIVIDQPALHGLLMRIRDLGLSLLLVERLDG